MEAATKPGAVRTEIVRRIYAERLIDRDPKRLLDEFASRTSNTSTPPRPSTRVLAVGGPKWAVPCDAPVSRSPVRARASRILRPRGCRGRRRHLPGGRRGSQSEIVERRAHTWTLREGRIVRLSGVAIWRQLQAAGLREWE